MLADVWVGPGTGVVRQPHTPFRSCPDLCTQSGSRFRRTSSRGVFYSKAIQGGAIRAALTGFGGEVSTAELGGTSEGVDEGASAAGTERAEGRGRSVPASASASSLRPDSAPTGRPATSGRREMSVLPVTRRLLRPATADPTPTRGCTPSKGRVAAGASKRPAQRHQHIVLPGSPSADLRSSCSLSPT